MNRGRGRAPNDGWHSTPRGRGRGRGQGGRSSRSGRSSTLRYVPVGAAGSSSDVGFNKCGLSHLGSHNFGEKVDGSISKQFNHTSSSNYLHNDNRCSPDTEDCSSDFKELKLDKNSQEAVIHRTVQVNCFSASAPAPSPSPSPAPASAPALAPAAGKDTPSFPPNSNLKQKENVWRTPKGRILDTRVGSDSPMPFYCVPASNNVAMQDDHFLPSNSDMKEGLHRKGPQNDQTPYEKTSENGCLQNSDTQPSGARFDICQVTTGTVKLKAPLHVQNRIKRDELKRAMEGRHISELRSGMLLLKGYIPLNDQSNIVNECRQLGLGAGGFYEPGYRDGGKLHLKMMCLGKNWDPETSKYGDRRPIDGEKPPLIPSKFHQVVKGSIQDAHSFLRGHSRVHDVEDVLPSMSPNICIVNFYTKSGRLGLHQDKDESPESINQGLPVVSISIGDSAEFLYSDQRDTDKAEKVILESGDVLIFGGKSRRIFHGVTAILPDTAPKALLEETHLRPGRLNLTFREY